MKTTLTPAAAVAAMSAITLGALAALGPAPARADGHYTPGVEGLQAASGPPPGLYYVGYLVDYNMNSFRAPGTSSNLPGSNGGNVTALANRITWLSNATLLGANYGMETIIPVVRTSLNVEAAGISDRRTGVGDIYLSPLVLSWHGPQWDAVATAGEWLDNGSTSGPAAPGMGFKGTMLTGGGTWYFDSAKTVTLSTLVRFEFNGKDKVGIRPGDEVTLEWGLGKSFGSFQAGVVGYSQWQVSDDSGAGATDQRASRHAIGLQFDYPIPSEGMILKAAAYKEIRATAGADAYPKGTLLRLTLAKAF